MRTTTIRVDSGEIKGHSCDARAVLVLEEMENAETKIKVRIHLDRNIVGYLLGLLREYAVEEKRQLDQLLKEFTP